jgi:predicted TPR repeat methyltransferase
MMVIEEGVVSALSRAANSKEFAVMRGLLEDNRGKHGDGPQFRYWEGVLAAREGRPLEALPLLEDAAHRAPRIPAPRYELGNVLATLGRLPEAAAAFESAIMLHQNFVAAWINLSAVRLRMKDMPRAERAIATAMNMDPNRVEAWTTLAKVQEIKHPDRAIDTLQEMRRRFGADSARDVDLLKLLVTHDKKQQAIELLEATLKQNPDDVTAKHLLAAHTGVAVARADDDYIRALFDEYASRYDQHMMGDLGNDAPMQLAQALMQHLVVPAEILDLGCGTGMIATKLPADFRLTGVDLSPAMLKIAETRNYAALHCEEISSFFARHTQAQYHGVVASDTFIYFGDMLAALNSIKRILLPDGVFAANFETERDTQEFHLETSGRYSHSAAYLRRSCIEAGLEVLRLDEISPRLEGGKKSQGLLLVAQNRS